jgi:hypothetical protein
VSRETVTFWASWNGLPWRLHAVIDKGLAILLSARAADGMRLSIEAFADIHKVPPEQLRRWTVEARERMEDRDVASSDQERV